MTLPFLITAMLMLAGAVAAMTLRKLVHCALALTVAFSGLAALYIELGAQFLGLAQVLVYVGAVAILIVFAILLTRSPGSMPQPELPQSAPRSLGPSRLVSMAVAAAVFALLSWAVHASGIAHYPLPTQPETGTRQIGDALMQRFVLPLEAIGLLLTAALIGAVIIALEEKHSTK